MRNQSPVRRQAIRTAFATLLVAGVFEKVKKTLRMLKADLDVRNEYATFLLVYEPPTFDDWKLSFWLEPEIEGSKELSLTMQIRRERITVGLSNKRNVDKAARDLILTALRANKAAHKEKAK